MKDVYLVRAKRSAVGRFGGGLAGFAPAELATAVAREVLNALPDSAVDEVILGQVLQAGSGMNVARQVALALGLPEAIPAMTVNMVCGSSLKAVALGADSILLGRASVVLAGGVEVMSRAPHYQHGLRWGKKLGAVTLADAILEDGLTDPGLRIPMGETAERIADHHGIRREEQDQFALRSQTLVAANQEALARERVKVGDCSVDEHPRPETTLEGLGKLRPSFRKEGSVTAGNASGINDGAAMILLADKAGLGRLGLEPVARIVAGTTVGCDPAMMGLGPVHAIRQLLKQANWRQEEVDLFEINEAFAAQVLGCVRALDLDVDKLNVRGGAIALGHPIGASGARVLTTLLHAMEDTDARRGIASLCVGGGMGIALALER